MSGSRDVGQEELILGLLGDLEGGERESIDAFERLEAAEREHLRRLDVELLGSLPLALEPVEPRSGAKAALLAAATGATEGGVAEFVRPDETASARRRAWLLPMAATLTAISLGLAGFLFGQLQGEKRAVARLRSELAQARSAAVEAASMREDMREAKRQLALVGTRGVEVCALRPRDGEAEAEGGGPWGVLYVAPDHQHWYLAVRGLEPTPEGQAYQLWFVADGGPVSAGTFSVEPGGPVELSSESMPEGTSAVMVTLEAIGGAPEPQGVEVLFGDGSTAVQVL